MKLLIQTWIGTLSVISLVASHAAFASNIAMTQTEIKKSFRELSSAMTTVNQDLTNAQARLKEFSKQISDHSGKPTADTKTSKVYTDMLTQIYKLVRKDLVTVQTDFQGLDFSGNIDPALTCKNVRKWERDFAKAQSRQRFVMDNQYIEGLTAMNVHLAEIGVDVTDALRITATTHSLLDSGQALYTRIESTITDFLKSLRGQTGCDLDGSAEYNQESSAQQEDYRNYDHRDNNVEYSTPENTENPENEVPSNIPSEYLRDNFGEYSID